MLARRADPSVDQGVTNRLRDRIEAALLGRFVRMVQVKFVDEFIERHRKIGNILVRDARHFGKVLRAGHSVSCLSLADGPCLDIKSKVSYPKLSGR